MMVGLESCVLRCCRTLGSELKIKLHCRSLRRKSRERKRERERDKERERKRNSYEPLKMSQKGLPFPFPRSHRHLVAPNVIIIRSTSYKNFTETCCTTKTLEIIWLNVPCVMVSLGHIIKYQWTNKTKANLRSWKFSLNRRQCKCLHTIIESLLNYELFFRRLTLNTHMQYFFFNM